MVKTPVNSCPESAWNCQTEQSNEPKFHHEERDSNWKTCVPDIFYELNMMYCLLEPLFCKPLGLCFIDQDQTLEGTFKKYFLVRWNLHRIHSWNSKKEQHTHLFLLFSYTCTIKSIFIGCSWKRQESAQFCHSYQQDLLGRLWTKSRCQEL